MYTLIIIILSLTILGFVVFIHITTPDRKIVRRDQDGTAC